MIRVVIEGETKNKGNIMNSRSITPEWNRLGVRILTYNQLFVPCDVLLLEGLDNSLESSGTCDISQISSSLFGHCVLQDFLQHDPPAVVKQKYTSHSLKCFERRDVPLNLFSSRVPMMCDAKTRLYQYMGVTNPCDGRGLVMSHVTPLHITNIEICIAIS